MYENKTPQRTSIESASIGRGDDCYSVEDSRILSRNTEMKEEEIVVNNEFNREVDLFGVSDSVTIY